MEFALDTLTEAFSDERFKAQRSDYHLFAFLLATSGDQGLMPGILRHFHDLHFLTGKHILIVAPRMRASIRGQPVTSEEIRRILVTGDFPQWFGGSNERLVDVQPHLDRFTEAQTRESYSLIRALGEPETALPSMVFFETLSSTADYALWSLRGMNGTDVVYDFRQLYQHLSEKCAWTSTEELERLRSMQQAQSHGSFLRPLGADSLATQLRIIRERLALSEHLRSLRKAVERAKLLRDRRFPLDNLEKLLYPSSASTAEEASQHMGNYYRRWKKRLAPELATEIYTVTELLGRVGSFEEDSDQLRQELSALETERRDVMHRAEIEAQDRKAELAERVIELEDEIASAKSPLPVIESFDRKRTALRRLKTFAGALPWVQTAASIG